MRNRNGHARNAKGMRWVGGTALALAALLGAEGAWAKVILEGYLKKGNQEGDNGIWVVARSRLKSNPSFTPARIGQTQTVTKNGKKGYYRIELDSDGEAWGNLTLYHNTYEQSASVDMRTWKNNNTYTQDISYATTSNARPTLQFVGLRESFYGLTRPTVVNWPTDMTPKGTPSLLAFNDNYDKQVGWWVVDAGWDWKQPIAPLGVHVLIVTQTEPNFQGEAWVTNTNGKTYVLWNKTANDSSDSHLKYLGSLKNQKDGTTLTESYVNLDALLSKYDAMGDKVYIQLEPGHFSVPELIKMAMKRFKYNADGSVKHPSISGIGLDIEWYKDTNPNADGESVTAKTVNEWERIAWGYGCDLFVKHWDIGQGVKLAIPTSDADGTVLSKSVTLVDDSQGFDDGFATQKSEFKKWADFYNPNPVAFQIGYPADKSWWSTFSKPVRDNINQLRDHFGAAYGARRMGFVWVDFSVRYSNVAKDIATHNPD